MPPSAYAQLLVVALEIYRNHSGKSREWVPTAEDWAALKADVETSTAAKLHADAAARRQTG